MFFQPGGIFPSYHQAYSSQKKSLVFCVFEVFEKTRGVSKLPHSYFLYVGVARWVTKLFRIEGENMRCREIQIGRNSFRKIRYFVTNILQLRRKTTMFKQIPADQKARVVQTCMATRLDSTDSVFPAWRDFSILPPGLLITKKIVSFLCFWGFWEDKRRFQAPALLFSLCRRC